MDRQDLFPSSGRVMDPFAPLAPASAYEAMALATATPRRLRVLLHEEAIRLCGAALESLDAGQVEAAADHLTRARRIVRQLQCGLGKAPAGAAGRFEAVYALAHRRLIEADFYRRRQPLAEVLALLSCGRQAWEDLAASSPAPADPPAGPAEAWTG